ncbi:hypothetical protein TTHERM_000470979 (macronuclear) [Tetrahymena thermophila SB210]|uniref:Uncharacterized protein n=1 Tax=Tetrahymena thermophila (strain SB210) TaxID=312017 RepID=W7XII5_TETTS|nr:hypothetical protein TTHERM_000470979 [Tetrahymena thermophila SB210]EWS73309.1 hypothetical protein TTHERM_000470979 [Tetrahymena thermophila SB210]|eukprot:XP_012654158.1 hypothetical protein TTHERM_000470979 [Tetrahymena thermophila SB210]
MVFYQIYILYSIENKQIIKAALKENRTIIIYKIQQEVQMTNCIETILFFLSTLIYLFKKYKEVARKNSIKARTKLAINTFYCKIPSIQQKIDPSYENKNIYELKILNKTKNMLHLFIIIQVQQNQLKILCGQLLYKYKDLNKMVKKQQNQHDNECIAIKMIPNYSIIMYTVLFIFLNLQTYKNQSINTLSFSFNQLIKYIKVLQNNCNNYY